MSKYSKNIKFLLDKIKDINGDIVELGVAYGTNSIIIGEWIKDNKLEKKYFGFDTFTGYTEEDLKTSPNNEGLRKNQLAQRWNINPKIVEGSLKASGVQGVCELVQGDIKTTFPDFAKKRFSSLAMVYVDCNAYLPAITALKSSVPYLVLGAIIVVDEHQIGGETKAFLEFVESYKRIETFKTGWHFPDGPSLYGVVTK